VPDDLSSVFEQARRTQTDFLRVDLDTGLILAERARTADHLEDRARNLRRARHAYDVVVSFLASATITHPDLHEIDSRLKRLRSELEKLGELF
jgi:hypothetical protein